MLLLLELCATYVEKFLKFGLSNDFQVIDMKTLYVFSRKQVMNKI